MQKDDSQPTRRKIVNWLLAISSFGLFGSMVYPVIRFISPPDVPEAATDQVEAGKTNDPDLLEKGFKIIQFGAEPVLVIRVAAGDYRAFEATCTHLDCIVEYQQEHSRIWCNCHNGEYDLTGKNISGPPPRPLPQYTVNVVDEEGSQPGTIVISRA